MRTVLATFVLLCLANTLLSQSEVTEKLQNADIIFQTSNSNFSKAINLATHADYSHVGLIFEDEGKFYVLEAVQPVKLTPLERWISRGTNGHFVVKRLKESNSVVDEEVVMQMKSMGETYLNKDYDPYFGWSDDRMYCSELVWKIYFKTTGLELGERKPLKSYDLSHPLVQMQLNSLHGDQWPMEELMISPQAIFDSDLLMTITSGGRINP